MGAAALKTGYRRAGYMPRRIKIRLAHSKRYDILGLRHDIEKLPDTALRQFCHMMGYALFHSFPDAPRPSNHLAINSSASAANCASLFSSSAPRIVTMFSQKVMHSDFSNIFAITRAAVGAQLPFSISPTTRFL